MGREGQSSPKEQKGGGGEGGQKICFKSTAKEGSVIRISQR